VATSRRNPSARSSPARPARDADAAAGAWNGSVGGPASDLSSASRRGLRRLPPVRLAPREELAAAARVAPLLRAARDVARWARREHGGSAVRSQRSALGPQACAKAAADLELAPTEVEAAWRVAVATRMLPGGTESGGTESGQPGSGGTESGQPGSGGTESGQPGSGGPESGDPESGQPGSGGSPGEVLASGDAEQVLAVWDAALKAILAAEDLDGLATALYTVGGPVRMEGLFDAYAAAAGTRRSQPESAAPDQAAALSAVLETLADLGVVELGTEEAAGGLTVALSPLGVWGVHRRLRAQGWHVPVLGGAGRSGAAGLLMTLASCDAEDGEAEISSWLAQRTPAQAAAELVRAAGSGTPGLRGAAFAVLDRIGEAAIGEVRAALPDPVLRAHASVWLHEHGEQAELRPEDRTWLLVDLGAGLLEEADPADVVAELLPDVSADAQAEIVASLWRVDHPGVTDLLTALSDHHPDPAVARAARKAAFKARSPSID
jgi:hypothetical protein